MAISAIDYDDRCSRQSEPNEYRGVSIHDLPGNPPMVSSIIVRHLREMLTITNNTNTCAYLVKSAIFQLLDWDEVPK